jgi:oligopeptide/dipeptide ABC transporter ATP-binding protein
VDGVSFTVNRRKTLGLVGESGCGKTTSGKTILRLIEPDSGEIVFNGENIVHLTGRQMKAIRKKMQIIYQDPFSSLNPRLTVSSIIGAPIEIHQLATGGEKKDIISDLLLKVGLKPADMRRYPHQFSGGQRQRIGIARALACNPTFIVGDEPVSALDVSIQAQIINLMKKLQYEMGIAYLFISHDISVVKHVSDEIAVMYLGKIVEHASAKSIYSQALHPYTQALLSAVPIPDPTQRKKRIILKGDVPNPVHPPKGCRFHPRCPYRFDSCEKIEPELKNARENHLVACHLQ